MKGANIMKDNVNDMRITESVASKAANAIVNLINSRPQSPRYDEIKAIIEKLAASPISASDAHTLGLDEYGPDLTK